MKTTHTLIASALIAMGILSPALPLRAAEIDGSYRLSTMAGSLYIKDSEDAIDDYIDPKDYYRYEYTYGQGGYYEGKYYNSDLLERESYPFPPEGVLAAVLGEGITVRDKRIRVNMEDARAQIVKVALHDVRLRNFNYFKIESLPVFNRFRRLENGTFYARTWRPLKIIVGVENTSGNNTVSYAWADYRARIANGKLTVHVEFRGNGGTSAYYEQDKWETSGYGLEGTARITALPK